MKKKHIHTVIIAIAVITASLVIPIASSSTALGV